MAALKLILESLATKARAITPEALGFYKQNCMICLDSQGHESGVSLRVNFGGTEYVFEVCWSGSVDQRMIDAYKDEKKATDFGACTIALLLLPELTGYYAHETSNIGSTIDYYLRKSDGGDDTLIFNNTVRLEVSGIRRQTPSNTVDNRVDDKLERLKRAEDERTFISIVEFSQPWSKLVDA